MGHVAVWMDGEEARVFHVRKKGFDEATVHSPKHTVHHPDDERRFFRELAHVLKDADRILILGPSTASYLFFRYLQGSDRALAALSSGLERRITRPTGRSPCTCVAIFGPRTALSRKAPGSTCEVARGDS